MRSLPALLLPLALVAALVAQDQPPTAPPPATKFVLAGHTDPVYSVAFSADGQRIATASFDRSVKLWDAATGKELRTFAGKAGHQNLVTAVAFSPDGSTVASVGTDNFARLWDVPTGKPQAEADLTAGGTKVATSPDGKLYAVGAADGSVKVFTTTGHKPTATLTPANTGPVLGLGFNQNGQTLYTLAADKVLRYWNAADGKPLGAVGATTGTVSGFAVNTATGQPVLATAEGVLATFPAAAPPPPKAFPPLGEAATAFALSADGVLSVVATADKKLKAFRTTEATPVFDIALPAAASKVAVNANGTQIAAVAGSQLHLVGADGKPRAVLPVGPLLDVAFVPNQPQFVTFSTSGTARTWTVPAAPLALKPAAHPDAVRGVALSADGKKLLTAGADKVVRLWNAGAVEREFKDHTAAVVAVGIAADSVVSADADGGVLFWNPADGKPIGKLAGPKKPVTALAVLPGTKTVAVGYADEVKLFAAPTTAEKDAKSFPHPKPVLGLAFHPDGKKVLSYCADGKARVLNLDTGKEDGSFDLTAKDKLAAVAVTADRTKLAEVGGGSLSVRAVADGKPAFTVPAAEATAVAWSADGKLVAVAGKGAVKVYDAATGTELQTVAEPTAAVKALAFLPDNRTLLFGGDDKALSPAEVWVTGVRPTAAATVGVLASNPSTALLGIPDKSVRLFETSPAPAAKEVKAFPGLPTDAKHVAISKDAQVVAAVSGKALKAWQVGDGKELSLAALPADGTRIAFNADRSKLAVALVNNSAVVIGVATGRVEQVVTHGGPVVGLAFHPSQPVLYTASADKTIQATPLLSPKIVADSARFGTALAVMVNGASVVSAGNGKGVAFSHFTSGAVERTISDLTGVTAVAINKANTQLAAYTAANQTITLYTLADGAAVGSWKAAAAVAEIAFHPTLPALVGVLADNRVVSWGTAFEAGQPLPPEFGKAGLDLPHPAAVKGFALTADSVVSAGDDKKLRAWKFATDAPGRNLQHPTALNAVAFDKTGTRLATGGQDGILRIWDLSKKENPAPKAISAHAPPAPAQPRAIYAVLWTPDTQQVVTASDDRSVKIWDATAGTLVREIKPGSDKPPPPDEVKKLAPTVASAAQVPSLNLPPHPGHTDQVYSLAITPDGKLLASGSADKTVKLWNMATGELVRAFVTPGLKPDGTAHPGFVQSVRFTPDGTKLVSVGTAPRNKGYLAVWNVADGKPLAAHELPIGPIYAVDVAADGTAVLACGPKVTRGPTDSEAVVLPLK
ncbi:MAG: hypothetical protein MUF18_17140 [Fimbriiglobus sp.]|nr:hypothetical protein [Fimbriiglobus sp.]